MYLGWVFDQWGDDDPSVPLDDTADFLIGLTLLEPDDAPIPGALTSVQFAEFVPTLLLAILPFFGGSEEEEYQINAYVDGDVTEMPPKTGNAKGTTLYRLREGIERFLITDINNPAASAQAQSEVFVMWDATSSNIAAYNHVPGGSNVLYMDGHVEWQRYPGEAPVSVNSAGALAILHAGTEMGN
jgi:prepilin-type processing-associated H-X9-DG protein